MEVLLTLYSLTHSFFGESTHVKLVKVLVSCFLSRENPNVSSKHVKSLPIELYLGATVHFVILVFCKMEHTEQSNDRK